jgi:hypothetical protein
VGTNGNCWGLRGRSPALSGVPFWVAVSICAVVASAGGASTAPAAERRKVDARTGSLEVPIDELMVAIRRKDRAEISRIAERIGPARLAQALRRADAPAVTAALTGIAVLPGGVRMLGPVTELVVTGDPPIAAAAARTVGDLLAPVGSIELDTWEVPPDVVDAACVVLRGAAILAANPTTVRLAALDALGDAAGSCPPTPELIALLRDPTPSVRRASALTLRPQQRLATGGFASGTRDVDKGVATASVAALCELLTVPGAGPRGGSASKEPIWEQTKQAARRMAVAHDTPAEDAVQMLECLDPTAAADRQVLETLRGRQRSPLGDRAAEILSQAARGRARP